MTLILLYLVVLILVAVVLFALAKAPYAASVIRRNA